MYARTHRRRRCGAVLNAGQCGDLIESLDSHEICDLTSGHAGWHEGPQWLVDGKMIPPLRWSDGAAGRIINSAASSIYGEIAAERARAHAKHAETSMESAPVDEMYRAVILGEEVGEVSEIAWAVALSAKFGYVQKVMNDGRHDESTDLAKLRKELIQVAAMAAAWADRIPPG